MIDELIAKLPTANSLKGKLTLLIIILLVMALLTTGIIAYQISASILSQQKSTQIGHKVEDTAVKIENWIIDRKIDLGLLARQDVLTKALGDGFVAKSAQEKTTDLFNTYIKEYENYYKNILLTNKNLELVVSAADQSLIGKKLKAEQLQQALTKSQGVVIDSGSIKIDTKETFLVTVPVNNGQGLLIGSINLDFITENYLWQMDLGTTEHVALLNDQTTIVNLNSSENLIKTVKNKNQARTIEVQGKQGSILTTSHKIASTGWTMIAGVNKKEILSGLQKLKQWLTIILLIILVLVGGVVWVASGKFVQPILKAIAFAEEIAEGNLKVETLEIKSSGEVGKLGQALNGMRDNLKEMVTELLEFIEDLSAYSEELSASTEEGTNAIKETTNLIENISANIQQISASTEEITSFAQEASSQTEVGSENIEDTIINIDQINKKVNQAVEVMNNLDTKSEEIGQIVELITNIAEQTNLLALNASIEAARAGGEAGDKTAGQGFAVVAEEIRELAERTAQSTDNIRNLIRKIQNLSETGVNSVQEVKSQAEQGKKVVEATGEVFEQIETSSQETATQIEQTASAVQNLAEQSDDVRTAVQEINDMSQEVANSSQELAEMAQKVQTLIEKFKV